MQPVLTIGITSYKRINELIRCIKSIQTQYVSDIEILVSEDKSPLSAEIKTVVEEFSKNIPYNIRFTSNEKNLGYDMNLGAIIKKASGKYIFFMSDDDAIYNGFLDILIPFLKNENTYGVLYAPFVYDDSKKKDRFRANVDFEISASSRHCAKYIYDAILFSGLIFRKEYVCEYDSSRFKNMNYFQVYLFLQMLLKYGGYYFSNPSVLCVGDGENAYGVSESSGGNAILANRKSVKSNLEFNKTLIKVIEMFDADEHVDVMESFARQYSIHSISGLSIARREGKQYFKEYWSIFNSLDIHIYFIARVYYILLLLFGERCTSLLLLGARKLIKKEK